ncbi:MAG: hypothetical protein RPV21_10840 [Candidatus Sedimenticola sp. (ex Thyasira tokunagai)]
MNNHSAKLSASDRLKRVDDLLASGLEYSTLDIVEKARVVAVNSIIAVLRKNGRDIRCHRAGSLWFYKRGDL